VVPPTEYHAKLKAICEEQGILFVADEVQTASAAQASSSRWSTSVWRPTS
jgi:glutamate-1-semialdehyde aminotransferase